MRIVGSVLLLLALAGCKVTYNDGTPPAGLPVPTAGTQAQQDEAATAARGFLALIDARQYDKTWEQAGSTLRGMTNQFTWTNSLKALKLLSPPGDRQIEGYGFTSQVDPGGPIGEYVMVQFKSRDGNVALTERVVMQKEQGTWKIVGFFATKKATIGDGS